MKSNYSQLFRPAWLLAMGVLAALIAGFVLLAPEAQAHHVDGNDHEFELRCETNVDTPELTGTVNEGDDFTLQAKWRKGNRGVGSWKAHWDTNEADPVSATENKDFEPEDEELHSKSRRYDKFNHTFHTKDDELWEGPETFYAGWSAIRPSGGSNRAAQYCAMTIIDDDRLEVTSALLWGNPADGSTYRPGETIRVRLTLNGKVEVPSDGGVHLYWDSEGTRYWRSATYNSELSTDTRPVYDYVVAGGDPAADEISLFGFFRNGDVYGVQTDGTVTTTTPRFNSVRTLKNYEQLTGQETSPANFGVDGRPRITELNIVSTPETDHVITNNHDWTETISEDTYRAGETIEFAATFNTEVEVDGTPALGIWVGSAWRSASYLRGSGTDTLVFGYTVRPEDQAPGGVRMDGGWREPNGRWHNFIYHDAVTAVGSDTPAVRSYRGMDSQAGHKVDGRPFVQSVEFLSEPVEDSTYWEGESLRLAFNFNNEVEVSGTPRVDLYFPAPQDKRDRGGSRKATYESGSGTKTLVFAYEVRATDLASDGVRLFMGGGDAGFSNGTITALNSVVQANPNYSGIYNDAAHRINGEAGSRVPPRVTDVKVTSNPGSDLTYTLGDRIEITVSLSEDIYFFVMQEDDPGFEDSQAQAPSETTHTPGNKIPAVLASEASLSALDWPSLEVQIGDETLEVLLSARDTKKMIFGYTVKQGDLDSDGISVVENSLVAGSYFIEDRDGNQAVLDHDELEPKGNHRVDAQGPTVSSIAFGASAGADLAYQAGDSVTVLVTFNEDVVVTGSPQVLLDVGGTEKKATYSHSAGPLAVFTYTVAVGDLDRDGISIGANKLILNRGSIEDRYGQDADLTHDAVEADPNRLVGVDTVPPTVSAIAFTSDPGSDRTYGRGDTVEITVTFSEIIAIVTGSPELELLLDPYPGSSDGMRRVRASLVSVSADGLSLVFTYAVGSSDAASDGLAVASNGLKLNGGTIVDVGGNDADVNSSSFGPDGDHLVNGSIAGFNVDASDNHRPQISSMEFTSDPGEDDTYGLGDTVLITVTFSEDVEVTGTPQLELALSEIQERMADYTSSSGAKVVFSYTVGETDDAPSGLSVNANGLKLNGGTIRDAAGWDANLVSPFLRPDGGHVVYGPHKYVNDVTPPTISSIEVTSDPGSDNTYGLGDVVDVTVTFSENVVVTGTPQLELALSEIQERTANYTSSSGAKVVFSYTVGETDDAPSGLSINDNGLKLNGGTIKDAAGNDAVLNNGFFGPDGGHIVDGSVTVPVVPTIGGA